MEKLSKLSGNPAMAGQSAAKPEREGSETIMGVPQHSIATVGSGIVRTWEQSQTHQNPEVGGSNPPPATSMQKSWFKYIIGWGIVVLVRLMPGRPPNVEPIMTVLVPFSKRYGWLWAFVFGFFSMAIYDFITLKVGIWTWVTAGVYGGVGVLAYFYFKNRSATAGNFVAFSIIGTLIFDALTMLIGPIFTTQLLAEAIIGQIPFSVYHLLSNIVFAFAVSPLIYRWVAEGEALPVFDKKISV